MLAHLLLASLVCATLCVGLSKSPGDAHAPPPSLHFIADAPITSALLQLRSDLASSALVLPLLTNWTSGADPCGTPRWSRVGCSQQDGGLPLPTSLNLTALNLTGTLPQSISDLTSLTLLNCSVNSLSGNLPDQLTSLLKLQELDLTANSFNGTLPASWFSPGAFSNLSHAHLAFNSLSGPLPHNLSRWTSLQTLSLDDNDFTGTVPDHWFADSSLASLRELYLCDNRLNGSLPDTLSVLTDLCVLDLSENQFSGTLPSNWFTPNGMTALTLFMVYGNRLHGTLPETMCRATGMLNLHFDWNRFTGSLPPSWFSAGGMTALTFLRFDHNRLTGTLPELSLLTDLKRLFAYGNQLTGTLPPSYSTLASLAALAVGANQLSGPLPVAWSSLTALASLDCSQLTLVAGSIPQQWSNLITLSYFNATGDTALCGPVELGAAGGVFGSEDPSGTNDVFITDSHLGVACPSPSPPPAGWQLTACLADCRPGYEDRGASCYKGMQAKSKGCCCYIDCCNNCDIGWIDTGCTCTLPPQSYNKTTTPCLLPPSPAEGTDTLSPADGGSGFPGWAVAIVVVGAVAILSVIIALAAFYVLRRRRLRCQQQQQELQPQTEEAAGAPRAGGTAPATGGTAHSTGGTRLGPAAALKLELKGRPKRRRRGMWHVFSARGVTTGCLSWRSEAASDSKEDSDGRGTEVVEARRSPGVEGKPDLSVEQLEIFEVLGRGGSGVVYRGVWKGVAVAAKVMLLCEDRRDQARRLLREASVSTGLSHANIVSTYKFDLKRLRGNSEERSSNPDAMRLTGAVADTWQLIILQELCVGGTLRHLMTTSLAGQHQELGQEAKLVHILQLSLDIACGLEHLHSKGVVHSDLTPNNVLLQVVEATTPRPAGLRWVAKVADFGLSIVFDEDTSHASHVFGGTPHYIAPETEMDGIISKQSDIFTFGLLMYEMAFCLSEPAVATAMLATRLPNVPPSSCPPSSAPPPAPPSVPLMSRISDDTAAFSTRGNIVLMSEDTAAAFSAQGSVMYSDGELAVGGNNARGLAREDTAATSLFGSASLRQSAYLLGSESMPGGAPSSPTRYTRAWEGRVSPTERHSAGEATIDAHRLGASARHTSLMRANWSAHSAEGGDATRGAAAGASAAAAAAPHTDVAVASGRQSAAESAPPPGRPWHASAAGTFVWGHAAATPLSAQPSLSTVASCEVTPWVEEDDGLSELASPRSSRPPALLRGGSSGAGGSGSGWQRGSDGRQWLSRNLSVDAASATAVAVPAGRWQAVAPLSPPRSPKAATLSPGVPPLSPSGGDGGRWRGTPRESLRHTDIATVIEEEDAAAAATVASGGGGDGPEAGSDAWRRSRMLVHPTIVEGGSGRPYMYASAATDDAETAAASPPHAADAADTATTTAAAVPPPPPPAAPPLADPGEQVDDQDAGGWDKILSPLPPSCPPELQALVKECLSRQPSQRPPAAEVRRRLVLLLDHHAGSSAKPPS